VGGVSESSAMRRPLLPAVGATVLALAMLLALTACSGDAPRTPTVASVNFDPTVELRVTDAEDLTLTFPTTSTDVSVGSVLLITNDGRDDHRITGTVGTTPVFDTGTMQPGNTTTIVISKDGDLVIRDMPTGRDVHLAVVPKPVS